LDEDPARVQFLPSGRPDGRAPGARSARPPAVLLAPLPCQLPRGWPGLFPGGRGEV